jgi:hypothetical protein
MYHASKISRSSKSAGCTSSTVCTLVHSAAQYGASAQNFTYIHTYIQTCMHAYTIHTYTIHIHGCMHMSQVMTQLRAMVSKLDEVSGKHMQATADLTVVMHQRNEASGELERTVQRLDEVMRELSDAIERRNQVATEMDGALKQRDTVMQELEDAILWRDNIKQNIEDALQQRQQQQQQQQQEKLEQQTETVVAGESSGALASQVVGRTPADLAQARVDESKVPADRGGETRAGLGEGMSEASHLAEAPAESGHRKAQMRRLAFEWESEPEEASEEGGDVIVPVAESASVPRAEKGDEVAPAREQDLERVEIPIHGQGEGMHAEKTPVPQEARERVGGAQGRVTIPIPDSTRAPATATGIYVYIYLCTCIYKLSICHLNLHDAYACMFSRSMFVCDRFACACAYNLCFCVYINVHLPASHLSLNVLVK